MFISSVLNPKETGMPQKAFHRGKDPPLGTSACHGGHVCRRLGCGLGSACPRGMLVGKRPRPLGPGELLEGSARQSPEAKASDADCEVQVWLAQGGLQSVGGSELGSRVRARPVGVCLSKQSSPKPAAVSLSSAPRPPLPPPPAPLGQRRSFSGTMWEPPVSFPMKARVPACDRTSLE